MHIQLTPAFLRIIPQDVLIFTEAVKMGKVDAREADIKLVIDAEILVDDIEMKKIAALPEIASALTATTGPKDPQYQPQDWRAKVSVMRDIQWKKKPIIDYIANTYKYDVIQAARDRFKSLPEDWVAALFYDINYQLESKTLQLSPSEDKKWKSVYVQISTDMGSIDGHRGFIGKFAKEFQVAIESGKISEADKIIFKSSLTGLDSALKALDPYSGAKMSSTKVHGWDVADEPGYDIEIRSGFQNRLTEVAEAILGQELRLDGINDDGTFSFSVLEYDTNETPEDIADEIEDLE